ncbi:MAG: glycosyltransferase [Limisphaerales bacterium]
MKLAFAILAYVSLALTFWRWVVACRFPLHRRSLAPPSSKGVTVLKPLRGCDADTKRCLKSWMIQQHAGPVQILFGVASPDDPVCTVVSELMAEHPKCNAELIICDQTIGTNAKVSSLAQLEPAIAHEFVIVSDADVFVPSEFLANVVPMFEDATVGLVNCFYRVANPSTLAMRWEAVAVNADFWSQVLQSRSLQDVEFALGAVMALPKAQLQKIGGFTALADYLADDYELGRRVAKSGKRIEFSTIVVDCYESQQSWGTVWAHQLRWARTIRICQPVPYFMSILNNASVWPLLWMIVDPEAVLCAVGFLLFRMITAIHLQSRLTQSHKHLRYFWLAPLSDLLGVAVWALSFVGNTVIWRGQRLRVQSDGRLAKPDYSR